MKPRIKRFYDGQWQCKGEVGHYGFTGIGDTPKQAYESYTELMYKRLGTGTKHANDKPGK